MSTTVLIDLAHLTGTATNGASTGMVEVRYSKRIEPADPASQIVVVRSFAVKLDATGKASVVVPPSEVDGFYTWAERVEGGITRYTSVPDVPTVNYRTLVDVDPTTLDPTVDATAAWWAMARSTVTTGEVVGDDLILTRTDGTTVNAGDVRGPQGDATLAISEDGTGGLVLSSDTALTDDGSGGVTITI